jgi:hypothetical protein
VQRAYPDRVVDLVAFGDYDGGVACIPGVRQGSDPGEWAWPDDVEEDDDGAL